MGKRRKSGGRKRPDASIKDRGLGSITKESSLIDPSSRGFVYDEVDDFENERDRLSLSRAQALMAKSKPSKEQVLGIDVSSSEDENEEEEEESDEDAMYMDDDIMEEYEERQPDERAWGSKKWRYIGTDTTDEKIHNLVQDQDEDLARLEEETARKLQGRMAAELENMVMEDLLPQEKDDKKKEPVESSVVVDLSGLSRTKKLHLLKRESPEFLPLLEDFKEKLKELKTFLSPLMDGVKSGFITSAGLCQYLTTKYRLVLNYVCVLSVYMMTKSSVGVIGQHPVVGRLAQYRQLLQELVPCDEKVRQQLEDLLLKLQSAKAAEHKKTRKSHQLQLLISRKSNGPVKKRKLSDLECPEDSSQEKKKESQHVMAAEVSSDEEEHNQVAAKQEGKGEEESLDPEGKRAITYQIAKNKGLTPSRKKDQRNPRVKYRNKYRTKLKKRKGQVRLVRKEIKRYEGEVSGIKSHTVKSIKIR